MTIRDALDSRLRAALTPAQSLWFTRATARAANGAADLLRMYTEASRQLGTAPLAATPTDGDAAPFARWALEDGVRLALLLARHDAGGDEQHVFADTVACYEAGDTREQRSWLRGVGYLPRPAQYLPIVIDACRTNILPLFEAVACENHYPSQYFPERNFNQLVLKAMFNGVALARIQGLADRANAELARMASDYADERRAAGRSVPADIGLALTGPPQRTHS